MPAEAPAPAVETPYARLGGETGVRTLVDRFYELMDTLPEARGVRAMHPPRLDRSAELLFKYLSGWLGGPPLYQREHGHPRLRARHLPFTIGPAERDQWLRCMRQALAERVADPSLRAAMERALADLAGHMVNRPG